MTALPDYRPLPLLANPHVQTILGSLFPEQSLTQADEQQVLLPDGDRLVLHDSVSPGWRPGGPIAVMVHGLGGSHRSGYLQRIGKKLLRLSWRVVRLDLRGCGKGTGLARKPYHAGCSADVREVLRAVHQSSPRSPIALAGFSLGGNIVLKLAGESADEPVPGLARVAAVAPPIDLVRSSDQLAQPRNRFYELHFLRELLQLVKRREKHYPDEPRARFPRSLTLRLFDELYTAPRSGFAGADDYYRRASAQPLIPRIQVPTLILTARDDPFVGPEPFEELRVPGHIEVAMTTQGGHLGFLGWDGSGGVRWAEERVLRWLVQ